MVETQTAATSLTPEELQRRWRSAFERACNRASSHTRPFYQRDGFYTMASSDGSGVYVLRLTVTAGAPVVTCNCPAGQHDVPCWHAGAVLLSLGFVVADDCPERSEYAEVAA